MSDGVVLGPEKVSLSEFTAEQRKSPAINWYRTPIAPGALKALHQKSDARGFFQTLGYLGIWIATATTALYSAIHWAWWITLGVVFLHGTVSAFMINGVHELGHGTVFKTKRWNVFFVHVLAFLGWINHEAFQASHTRHHRYTLHPPDDLEVVLPIRLMIRHFLLSCLVNPPHLPWMLKNTLRIARGDFQGEWELTLHPPDAPEKRRPAIRWARILLAGHSLIVIVSLLFGWWMVPIVITLSPCYGSWLFFLCNNTQHIGLQDNVPDFRLCCRTFTLNPLVRFLYWQMNYHTEHHMYAAVPCYNLGRLHALIKHDLPPCPAGLFAVWKEIASIQARQEADPHYQHHASIPRHPYHRS
jgi:fatty acid desaturase